MPKRSLPPERTSRVASCLAQTTRVGVLQGRTKMPVPSLTFSVTEETAAMEMRGS